MTTLLLEPWSKSHFTGRGTFQEARLGTQTSCVKADEKNEMPFGGQTSVGSMNRTCLDWAQIPTERENIEGTRDSPMRSIYFTTGHKR